MATAAAAFIACLDGPAVAPPVGGPDDAMAPALAQGGRDDSGAPDTAAAADASPRPQPTRCDSVVSPPGAQFLCEDFDKPTLDPRWKLNRQVADWVDAGQAFGVSTESAHSPPASWRAYATDSMQLTWGGPVVGALENAIASVQIQPTADPSPMDANVQLVLLEILQLHAALQFGWSRGQFFSYDAATKQTVSEVYNGYYLRGVGQPDRTWVKVQSLTPDLWQEVKLTWSGSGTVHLAYDGVEVFTYDPSSSGDGHVVVFGLGTNGPAGALPVPSWRFDDVQLSYKAAMP